MTVQTQKIQDLNEETNISNTDLLVLAKDDNTIPPKKLKLSTLIQTVENALPFTPKVIGWGGRKNSSDPVSVGGIVSSVEWFAGGQYKVNVNGEIFSSKHIVLGNGNGCYLSSNLPEIGSTSTSFTIATIAGGYVNYPFQFVILQFLP